MQNPAEKPITKLCHFILVHIANKQINIVDFENMLLNIVSQMTRGKYNLDHFSLGEI